MREWAMLSVWVKRFLYLAGTLGKVYIVTNSETGWVEHSIKEFMPSLIPLLPQLNIISARSLYSDRQIDDKTPITQDDLINWKHLAFLNIVQEINNNCHDKKERYRTVAIGDSWAEIKALEKTNDQLKNPITKWIKFTEDPSIPTLCKQIRHTTNILYQLTKQPTTTKLDLTETINIPTINPFIK